MSVENHEQFREQTPAFYQQMELPSEMLVSALNLSLPPKFHPPTKYYPKGDPLRGRTETMYDNQTGVGIVNLYSGTDFPNCQPSEAFTLVFPTTSVLKEEEITIEFMGRTYQLQFDTSPIHTEDFVTTTLKIQRHFGSPLGLYLTLSFPIPKTLFLPQNALDILISTPDREPSTTPYARVDLMYFNFDPKNPNPKTNIWKRLPPSVCPPEQVKSGVL